MNAVQLKLSMIEDQISEFEIRKLLKMSRFGTIYVPEYFKMIMKQSFNPNFSNDFRISSSSLRFQKFFLKTKFEQILKSGEES